MRLAGRQRSPNGAVAGRQLYELKINKYIDICLSTAKTWHNYQQDISDIINLLLMVAMIKKRCLTSRASTVFDKCIPSGVPPTLLNYLGRVTLSNI